MASVQAPSEAVSWVTMRWLALITSGFGRTVGDSCWGKHRTPLGRREEAEELEGGTPDHA